MFGVCKIKSVKSDFFELPAASDQLPKPDVTQREGISHAK